jgi:excisionase family DNA binding protein
MKQHEVKHFRVAEVAQKLGVGRSTVYELCERGDLGYVHVGRSIRIPEDELETYLTTHRHRGRRPAA